MPAAKSQSTLVEAVQAVFSALEPFDESARQRILASVTSLLGSAFPSVTAASGSGGAAGTIVSRSTVDRPVSPVELLQEKKPVTNPQRIAVFAYYRERAEGVSRFNKDDLKPYFAKAKLPPPQNYDRDYRKTVKLGWIYDDGADSYLTSKGLESVEAGFEGKGLPRGLAAPKRQKRKSAPKKR